MLLETIKGPRDVQRLSREEAIELAAEIRTFLVSAVARTGGHLGPNLGVVELTIALHRAFDSPRDTIVFDTGHQSYVHKLLTGRQDFSALRAAGAACRATPRAPRARTTSSRTRTRRRPCRGPTASPKVAGSRASATATSSP